MAVTKLIDDVVDTATQGARTARRAQQVRTLATMRHANDAATKAVRTVTKPIGTAVNKTVGVPVRAVGRAIVPPIRRAVSSKYAPRTATIAAMAIGGAAGIASGVKSTFQDVNRSLGNPAGYAADLSVKTAFTRRSSGSDKPSAPGTIVTRSRR